MYVSKLVVVVEEVIGVDLLLIFISHVPILKLLQC